MPRGTDLRGVTWREGPREQRPTGGIVIRAQTRHNSAVVAAIGFAAMAPLTAPAHAQSRRAVTPAADLATFEVNTDRIQTTLLEVRLAETEPATGLDAATVLSSNNKVYLH